MRGATVSGCGAPYLDPVPPEEPDYRMTLANERTFLAWIRTSLALLAGGVAVVQIAPRFGVAAGRAVLAELLIVLAIVLAADSVRRWQRVQEAMRHGEPLPRSPLPRVLAVGLVTAGVLSFVLVLLSP